MESLDLNKLEELSKVITPICKSIRNTFEEEYEAIFTQYYAKDVNWFYLHYKRQHNLTKQFSKDGKIFYHDVEV